MWILFSLSLDLLEGKQSLSVGEFDNAQIEYILVALSWFLYMLFGYFLYAFATNIAQSYVYMFVASQDQRSEEKTKKRSKNEMLCMYEESRIKIKHGKLYKSKRVNHTSS